MGNVIIKESEEGFVSSVKVEEVFQGSSDGRSLGWTTSITIHEWQLDEFLIILQAAIEKNKTSDVRHIKALENQIKRLKSNS
ncbi:MAG: hypothetical protein COA78_22100 [Blastopirellula sp.]|nr:MAG: hypothetical protein COA78_22100 [Blastopirellula sp.]